MANVPLISLLLLESSRCRELRVLGRQSEFLLTLLEHLPTKDSVTEAVDLVLLLVTQATRRLRKIKVYSLQKNQAYHTAT